MTTPAEADDAVQAVGVRAHSRASRAAALALAEGAARLAHDARRLAWLDPARAPETWPPDPWKDTPEALEVATDLGVALQKIHSAVARLRASLAAEEP